MKTTAKTLTIASLLIGGLIWLPATGEAASREQSSAPAHDRAPAPEQFSRADPVVEHTFNPPQAPRDQSPRPAPLFRQRPSNPVPPPTRAPAAEPYHRRADITDVVNLNPWPIDPNTCDNNSTDNNPYHSSDNSTPAGAVPINIVPVNPPAPLIPAPAGPSPIALAAQAVNTINKDPQMIAANTELADAQTAYNTERKRVLTTWQASAGHQQLLALKQKATTDFEAAESTDEPQSAMLQAAIEKLNASSPVTQMQEQAIAGDPAVIAARKRLDAAVAGRDATWTILRAAR